MHFDVAQADCIPCSKVCQCLQLTASFAPRAGGGFLGGRRREQVALAEATGGGPVRTFLPTPEQRPMLNTAVRQRVDVFGRAAGEGSLLRNLKPSTQPRLAASVLPRTAVQQHMSCCTTW